MESQSFIQDWAVAFDKGGLAMYAIVVALMLSLVFTIERFFRLFLSYNVNAASFMAEIEKYLRANDLDGAIRTCNGTREAVLPKVIKAGLQRAKRSEAEIQNAIDAASLEAVPKLEKSIPYLATIANIATLLGLFGTISGLITSFAAIELADPAQRQAILSAGISEAMFATKFGLLVAIMTMVFHSILSNKATKLLADIDEFGVKLMDVLATRKYRHASEKIEN